MRRLLVGGVLLAALVCCGWAFAELPKPADPLWKPEPDHVYLQEVGRQVRTDAPLTAVAVFGGAVYAGSEDGLLRLDGDKLVAVKDVRTPVRRLKTAAGRLWALTDGGLFRFDDNAWARLSDRPATDLCEYRGVLAVTSRGRVDLLDGERWTPLAGADDGPPVLGIACYADTLYVHFGDRLAWVDGERFNTEDVSDWGRLQPGCTIRDMLSFGSRLILATDEGLGVLRGMTWYAVQGEQGLPYADTTCLAPGFDRDLWIGTAYGAVRDVSDGFQLFAPQRWLPDGRVHAVACGERAAYVATDKGLGIIEYEPYTLAKKAAWYERWLDEWGHKRLGFTHKLEWDKTSNEWVREVSDNDAGWTSHYLDALCFKYAVTKDPAVRAQAVDVMKTLKWCEEITPIEGFPARSIWAVGEQGHQAQHGSGGLPAEWHRTPDGLWEWKGDTSSDEVDAHVYATTLFLELVAEGPEVDMAKEHLHRIVGHIVDNGWVLRDVDGQPTRWARWDPEYLQRPYGFYARGLNGMEALNYVTSAYHFTGDPKFLAGKQQLIEWKYPQEILREKLTFHPGFFTIFDDRLAFYAYYPLLRYETDPDLKALWRRSLERSWEVKRIDNAPWFAYIYGVLTGNDCENGRATAHLREWPLDLVSYSFDFTKRDDLHTPEGYREYGERLRTFSPRECGPKRWDSDYARLAGGANGEAVEDPSTWLDAYWMARYFGFIEAPTTDDPTLLTVPERGLHLGAKPYAGPPRPPVWHERTASTP